jgi:hypothetical protein
MGTHHESFFNFFSIGFGPGFSDSDGAGDGKNGLHDSGSLFLGFSDWFAPIWVWFFLWFLLRFYDDKIPKKGSPSPLGFSFESKISFKALESIFEVRFVFFGVFRLSLAGN